MIDMPPRIAALRRDHRGYPVPYIVLSDKDGQPIFTANDQKLVYSANKEGLCHICGQKLDEYVWFTSGPGSALLNEGRGVYFDGPMHHECMQFAMKICPHLSQQMTKAIGPGIAKRLMEEDRLDKDTIGIIDTTTIPGVPEIFVSVSPWKYEVSNGPPNSAYSAYKPFRKVEYWKQGQMLSKDEGEKLARKTARELASKIGKAKVVMN